MEYAVELPVAEGTYWGLAKAPLSAIRKAGIPPDSSLGLARMIVGVAHIHLVCGRHCLRFPEQ